MNQSTPQPDPAANWATVDELQFAIDGIHDVLVALTSAIVSLSARLSRVEHHEKAA